jgi:hypothetical protein
MTTKYIILIIEVDNNMKRIFIITTIIVIIVIIGLSNFSLLATKIDNKFTYRENYEEIINYKDVVDKILENKLEQKYLNNEFGIWIHTKYNGRSDNKKLDIDLISFKLMLDGGGWRYYQLSLEDNNDSIAGLQFSRTKIYLEEEQTFIDVMQTQFNFETSCNTNEDFEVSLEVRFPFSLLKSHIKSHNKLLESLHHLNKIIKNNFLDYHLLNPYLFPNTIDVNSESFFEFGIGYLSPENDKGPNRIETRFFFGRNSIFEPRVFRMKITPYDLNREYKLSYFNNYRTVDDTGNEQFFRSFSIDFEPAVELQITSIPGEGKIKYDFGNSGGLATKISLNAKGGILSDIIQSFIIDPLPEYMAFDLTILGERVFKYESSSRYSVSFIMDSIDEGNFVKLELNELPKTIIAEWGLKVFLSSLSGSGFVDLDMSGDLGRISLSLLNSDNPFIEIDNFPQKLRVDGFVDIPRLQGSLTASKYSGPTTILNIPLKFDKWEILGSIYINNGYGHSSFNLPDESSDYVSFGFDTNDNSLFGFGINIFDREQKKQILYIAVDAIATDDFFLSFNYVDSEIKDFKLSGKITELIDFVISIDYQTIGLNLSTSWILGNYGSFEIVMNKEISINLDQIDFNNIELDGVIGVYPGTKLIVDWQRGDSGYFKIQTDGIDFTPSFEMTFSDKNSNEIFITGSVILNPSCILKFDWVWGETGHFTIFTNNLIEEVFFEVGYNYQQNIDEFQYGFKISGDDINIIRTIQWDTQDGIIPRIWILGDETIPGIWDVWLLWQYEWYEVK